MLLEDQEVFYLLKNMDIIADVKLISKNPFSYWQWYQAKNVCHLSAPLQLTQVNLAFLNESIRYALLKKLEELNELIDALSWWERNLKIV